MNRIYRHIWSKALGRLVVVPECARGAGGGKAGRRRNRRSESAVAAGGGGFFAALLASTMLATPAFAQEVLPTGGQVVSGSATIATDGATMTINQSSDRMIANWQGFSIGAGNSVTFNQPGASSVALNRVTGQNPSQILGSLNANGQVFLINPNGVAIGTTGRVQTGAFVASTLGMSDADFLDGTYSFTGTGGSIVNDGGITGGTVALIAPSVSNRGTITGNTALAGGTDVLLDFDGDGLLSVEVKGSTVETLVENKGLIKADGGVAILTAKGASAAMKGVVNNTGTVEANSIGTKNGRILLLGDMQHGEVKVAGKLKAKKVETSAAKVKLDRTVKVETSGGHWLIDPTDITIDADYAATLQANLANGNITISTASAGTDAGNITVASAITWSANTLELVADNNIAINAALSGGGGLTLRATGTITAGAAVNVGAFRLDAGKWVQNGATLPGFSATDFTVAGGSFLRVAGGNGSQATPYVVTDVYGLQGIGTSPTYRGASWKLGNDIDASATANWIAKFAPIGQLGQSFTGRFDGAGHVISGLVAWHDRYAGLFGYVSSATFENVGIVGGQSVSARVAGGLVAETTGTTVIRNVYSSTVVQGGLNAGGLVGTLTNGSISDSYSTSTVTGGKAGGLVGRMNGGSITNAFASGSVSGGGPVGGLVGGIHYNGTISSSYWDIDATGTTIAAGLNDASTVSATGLTTDQALQQSAYAGFDFTNTWFMIEGSTRPFLRSEWQTTITNAHQLQLMAMNLSASYTLGRNIDLSMLGDADRSDMWATSSAAGAGFSPVGNLINPFTGTFDGQGHTISGLFINRANAQYVGLFGRVVEGTIKNVRTVGSKILGSALVGGLIGQQMHGSISNVHVSGTVSGTSIIGGLAASVWESAIRDSSSVTNVSANSSAGGLVSSTYATTMTNVYAAGTVSAWNTAGGLIGNADRITLNNAYATGVVDAYNVSGGLVGSLQSGSITNAYVDSLVYNGGSFAGTLAGYIEDQGASIASSFWNADKSGQVACGGNGGGGGCGVVGLTAAQMADPFSFIDAGWDFTSIWARTKAGGMPVLRALAQEAVFDSYLRLRGDIVLSYGDAASIGGIQVTSAGTGNISLGWGSAINAGTNVGRYGWGDSGVLTLSYSTGTAADYYVDYGTGGLTVEKRVLSLSGSRTYDGSKGVAATVLTLGNLANGETLALSGSGLMADKNAGNGKTFSLETLALGDGTGLAANYTLVEGGDNHVDIAKAITSVTGITAMGKTYNGTTDATLVTMNAGFTGMLAGDDLWVNTATGHFSDKNAGDNKRVDISGLSLGGMDAANYSLADDTATTTATIDRAFISDITGLRANSKVYDGQRTVTLDTQSVGFVGLVAGDSLTIDSISGLFDDANAGIGKALTAYIHAVSGADIDNYVIGLSMKALTGDIDRATLTLGGFTVADKIYDGTRAATFTGSGPLSGVVGADDVAIDFAGVSFDDKNAGVGKTVTMDGIGLVGGAANNYTIAATATTSAWIAKATISSVTGITADGKTYDGTRAAVLNTGTAGFTGMVANDALTVASASGAFADRNAGTGKRIDITGLALGGADAGNYVLADATATATADIAKATISSVTGITASNKTYDGTTAVTLDTTGVGFAGMVAGDGLALQTFSGAFASKAAGSGRQVNITGLTLGGRDAGNYVLADDMATTTADIARATLTLTDIAGMNRTYDGTTAVGVFGGSLTGVLLSDDVGFGYWSTAFSDKNVGLNKVVTIDNVTLHGADADNYTIASTATTTASISKRAIYTLSGITAANKTYDGTRAATLDTSAASFTELLQGDELTVASATGTFSNKNAGGNKTVAISDVVFGGADAGNYELYHATTLTAAADIDRATLSAVTGLKGYNKTYDGTTFALVDTGSADFVGKIAGDELVVLSATGVFADRNVGTGKAVAISGLTLGGVDAANYLLADTTATGTADITKATLYVNGFTAAGKVYDGTTAATVTAAGSLSGRFQNDDVSFSHSGAAFTDKNAGSGKTVRLNGIALSGADAANYTVADTTTAATISRATIASIAGIDARDKLYDGTRTARLDTAGATFAGLLAGDSLTVGAATARFDDASPGQNKTVRVNGLTLGGLDAGNYVLLDDTAVASADINALSASPLPRFVAGNGGRGGFFGGAFFTLSTRAFFTEPVLIDFSGWQPGAVTFEDVE